MTFIRESFKVTLYHYNFNLLDVHGYRMVSLVKHATGGKFGRTCNCQQVWEDLKPAEDERKIV